MLSVLPPKFCPLSFSALFAATIVCALFASARMARALPVAATEPDTIVFINGDHLSGKLLRSVKDKVQFHSDIAGDITVSWDKVKELHSSSSFVVLRKGAVMQGRHAVTNQPEGTLHVEDKKIEVTKVGASGSESIPVANADYVIDKASFDRAIRNRSSLLTGWSGNATAGATLVSATQNSTTVSGGFSAVRVAPVANWLSPRNRMLADFSGSYGKVTQPGVSDVKTEIYHADAERDEYFSARFYVLGQVAFDHNYSQSLDLQQIYGAGLGRTLLSRPAQTLDVKATAQYERQNFLGSTLSTEQNLFGTTFSANYMRKFPKGIVFVQQANYIPAWSKMHDYSLMESDTLTLPAYKHLGFSLGTIDSYLNDPAVTTPPTKRNSFQFTMGATYSFAAR